MRHPRLSLLWWRRLADDVRQHGTLRHSFAADGRYGIHSGVGFTNGLMSESMVIWFAIMMIYRSKSKNLST